VTASKLMNGLAAAVVPALLCIVAARQVYLVRAERLTPWKGGGFGMFATVESGATRVVRVSLEKRDGDRVLALPVKLPTELAPIALDLSQRPTRLAAENLAIVLARLPWLEAPELDEIYRLSAPEFAAVAVSSKIRGTPATLLRGVLEKPRAWIGGLKSSGRFGGGRPIEFDQTVVEVWQLEFDDRTRTVTPRRIVSGSERHLSPRAGAKS
jgi:hypothetical protein